MGSTSFKGEDGVVRSEEEIERLIDEGHEDPSMLFGKFSGSSKRRQQTAVKKINLDLTVQMLSELDAVADLLNISRQAVIKTYLKNGLDKHFIASSKRGTTHQEGAAEDT